MAIKTVEIQDSLGDVYHPHTVSEVVFHEGRKVSEIIENTKLNSYYSLLSSVPNEDSSLIRTEDGKFILIDTGYESTSDKLIKKIKNQGVKQLEILIITHSHSDHIGGAANIIKEFRPKMTYYKEVNWNMLEQSTAVEIEWKTKEYHNKMKKALADNNCNSTVITSDITEIKISEKESFTIYNGINIDYKDYNSASLIILYRNAGTKLLLPGDVTADRLEEYQEKIGYCHFCKLPHHGAYGNTQLSWLENHIYPGVVLANSINYPNVIEAFEMAVWAGNAQCYYFKETDSEVGTVNISTGGVSVSNGLTRYNINSRVLPMFIKPVFNKIKYYFVDGNGELVKEGVREANGILYFIQDWKIQDEPSELGWKVLDGHDYYVKSGGICARNEFIPDRYTTPGQAGTYYYLDDTGRLVKNTSRMVGGKWYRFDHEGKPTPSPI